MTGVVPPSRAPALIRLHKILIASAAALGVVMTAWSVAHRSWLVGAASVSVAVALVAYYRTIDRRYGG